MLGTTIQPEIHKLIEAKDFATLKATIREMEIHDLTELISELEGEDLALVFRFLPRDQAADIFGDLPIERQGELLEHLSSQRVAAILNDMPPDERTELLEELPGQLAQGLLNWLAGDQLRIARSLLNYPEDSIGRLITPNYLAVRPDWTIEKVLRHIRKVATKKETLNVVYVVDDHWKLLDEITLEQIVLSSPDTQVRELMDETVAFLEAHEDQESAIYDFKKYEAVALPVVDSRGILVGIVTFDDVIDVVQEEDTEDFQKMAGMGVLEYSYFGTGFWSMIGKRLPWLVLLLFAQTLTTVALSSFQALPLFVVLAVFVPLINSPAGNTGSQIAGLMIRGLAVQEMDIGDWFRILRRELLRGFGLGVPLGVLGYGASFLFARAMSAGGIAGEFNAASVALSVSIALILVVMLANIIGSMLPFFFKRFGIDPAVTSGPFIASMMDVASVLIYFSIAVAILKAT